MFLRDTQDILDRVAIADAFERQLTYGDLENMSEEYAKCIPPRSLVMILCDYEIDTVAFYYCQMVNHVVPILIDGKLEPELLENLLTTYQPEYIWCMEESERQFSDYMEERVYSVGRHILIRTHYLRCEMNPQLAG